METNNKISNKLPYESPRLDLLEFTNSCIQAGNSNDVNEEGAPDGTSRNDGSGDE